MHCLHALVKACCCQGLSVVVVEGLSGQVGAGLHHLPRGAPKHLMPMCKRHVHIRVCMYCCIPAVLLSRCVSASMMWVARGWLGFF